MTPYKIMILLINVLMFSFNLLSLSVRSQGLLVPGLNFPSLYVTLKVSPTGSSASNCGFDDKMPCDLKTAIKNAALNASVLKGYVINVSSGTYNASACNHFYNSTELMAGNNWKLLGDSVSSPPVIDCENKYRFMFFDAGSKNVEINNIAIRNTKISQDHYNKTKSDSPSGVNDLRGGGYTI